MFQVQAVFKVKAVVKVLLDKPSWQLDVKPSQTHVLQERQGYIGP